jgi:hypothetical protein
VKLLKVQSSPRGESSDSITLTKLFIKACKFANNSIVVDTLNVWHERLPEFDYEAIGAKYKAVKHETMTEAESRVWERIQSLIQRFQNADRILVGTPMWNFGLPYKLKQLIYLVAPDLGETEVAALRDYGTGVAGVMDLAVQSPFIPIDSRHQSQSKDLKGHSQQDALQRGDGFARDGPRYAGFTRKTVAAETDGTFHWGYFLPLAWSTDAFSTGSSTTDKVRSNTLSAILRRTWGSRIIFSTHCLPR